MADPRTYPTDADEDAASVAAEIEEERALRDQLGIGREDGEHAHPEDISPDPE